LLFKKPETVKFLSIREKEEIVNAIQEAERKTSGEIRVFIEKKCSYVDPLDRAVEVFGRLSMEKTVHHNAVLIYIAYKDRQMAVYGDRGIHEKLGNEFWSATITDILANFKNGNMFNGLKLGISSLGEALLHHFPYHNEDKNELPDNIVFGD
jgi:uncharacterized membrane protein